MNNIVCFFLIVFSPWLIAQVQPDTTYAVTWTLIECVSLPDERSIDEYGQVSQLVNTVYRFKTVSKEMSKEFISEKEADEFIKNMPMRQFWGSGCENPKKQRVIKENIEITNCIK